MTKKILIIDDNDDQREILMQRLMFAGYEVIDADKGFKGIDVALLEKPDIVILDLMMPGMSGYEVWREFQKVPELKKIPIIILTAKRRADDKFFGTSVPMKSFISKPYESSVLIERIAEILKWKTS